MFFRNLRREAFYEKMAEALVAHSELESGLEELNKEFPDLENAPAPVIKRIAEGCDALNHLNRVIGELFEKAPKYGVTESDIEKVMRAKGLSHIVDP